MTRWCFDAARLAAPRRITLPVSLFKPLSDAGSVSLHWTAYCWIVQGPLLLDLLHQGGFLGTTRDFSNFLQDYNLYYQGRLLAYRHLYPAFVRRTYPLGIHGGSTWLGSIYSTFYILHPWLDLLVFLWDLIPLRYDIM